MTKEDWVKLASPTASGIADQYHFIRNILDELIPEEWKKENYADSSV